MMNFNMEEFNFEHSVENNNRRAEKAGAIANLTVEQFETAYIYFGGKCAYSGQKLTPGSFISIEHIIPVVSGGHSMAFNCIPVNGKYNSSKSGYHLLDWWKCQTDGMGHSIYSPYRLLKILNYMLKCLESINKEDGSTYVLTDNEIDVFLAEHLEEGLSQIDKSDFRRISQLEIFAKMDMLSIEDFYSMYSELDKLKINAAIFFEEAIYELRGAIPEDIIRILEGKIKDLPNIYVDDKKVFKSDMDEIDINIRKEVLEWATLEGIENKYGIIGYMDFEVLKRETNITEFLNRKKESILKALGATPSDFNNIVNKIPNILTDLNVEKRIEDLSKTFNISRKIRNGKSSELLKVVTKKPDLILSGENMEILLKYASELHIDKRLLKKGIPIATIIDNIETGLELVDKAELGVDDKLKKRIFDKLINNTTGNLLRAAFRTFKTRVKVQDERLSKEEIERDAARWMLCISEKYNASEILKPKRINKTKGLYSHMEFNAEGHLVGVNPNAYIVPQIVAMANFNMSREAENELINNVFFSKRIRQGERADKVLRELGIEVKKDHANYEEEDVVREASRWFVFLSESSKVPLDELFNKKTKQRYIDATRSYYPNMQFDEKGNFIDIPIPELEDLVIGVDYKDIVDSFIKSTGNYYIIKGKYIEKSEIQSMIYSEISKCKNKKAVRSTCIKILKALTSEISRKNGEEMPGGEDR